MEQEHLLTRRDVMEYLRVSPGTLDKLVKKHELPCIKLERKVLFRKSAIDAWLESKRVK